MGMNRRDLFKYFGAGALIAPVIAGRAEIADTARLIETPRIVEPSASEVDLYTRGESGAALIRVEIQEAGRPTIVLAAKAVALEWKRDRLAWEFYDPFDEAMSVTVQGTLLSGMIDLTK